MKKRKARLKRAKIVWKPFFFKQARFLRMASSSSFTIKIKLANQNEALNVQVFHDDTVQSLTLRVLHEMKMDLSADKKLRLLYNGKELTPQIANAISSFKLQPDSFLHAVISNLPPTAAPPPNLTRSDVEPQGRGGGGGFNSLIADRGLVPDDIMALRVIFSQSLLVEQENLPPRLSSELPEEYRNRVESAWMLHQPQNGEFYLNLPPRIGGGGGGGGGVEEGNTALSFFEIIGRGGGGGAGADGAEQGTTRDFLFGLIIGYFLGFFVLFCIWDTNIPYRQKIGLLLGVSLSLLSGLRLQNEYQAQQQKQPS